MLATGMPATPGSVGPASERPPLASPPAGEPPPSMSPAPAVGVAEVPAAPPPVSRSLRRRLRYQRYHPGAACQCRKHRGARTASTTKAHTNPPESSCLLPSRKFHAAHRRVRDSRRTRDGARASCAQNRVACSDIPSRRQRLNGICTTKNPLASARVSRVDGRTSPAGVVVA